MNSATLPEAPHGIVRLPANGATVTAEELRNDLVCAAEHGTSTLVDGSTVQTVGQAVLQLLVAARRDAAAAGRAFAIVDASDALRARAETCNLAEAIGLDAGRAPAL